MSQSTHDLVARIGALEGELRELRRQLSGSQPEAAADEKVLVTANRRGAVKMLAAGAVGAVTGLALQGRPAAADDGDPLWIGLDNVSANVTFLRSSSADGLNVHGGNGHGLVANGTGGNARFVASGNAPGTNKQPAGVIWVDGGGNWWGSVASGIWRKLAGPATAGSLHMLPNPVRVYDTRPDNPPTVGPKQPLAPEAARTVDAKFAGVPANATAAVMSFVVFQTTDHGFASMWPSGAFPGVSQINYAPGQTVGATLICGLAQGTVQVMSLRECGVAVDVYGYFL